MFETLRQDTQGQRLHLRDSFGLVGSIAEHSREIGNLGDPPAILLAFELNLEGHIGTLAPERRPNKQLRPPRVSRTALCRQRFEQGIATHTPAAGGNAVELG